MFPVRKDNK